MKDAQPPQSPRTNVVLVGMPGAGKSTVGVVLAKAMSMDFIDTDVLIQTAQCRSLQTILDEDGYMALRGFEEAVLLGLRCRNTVIATGGSAVYSSRAMRHLKSGGTLVFLSVSLALLRHRVADFDTRGIARAPGQSFSELYTERVRLYRQYADAVVHCGKRGHEKISAQICRMLRGL